ncbi:putative solute carrier family 22 member 31 isoform X2 [Phaenicophaeus curvirostris]|uniref:putative solute carrier family 22 member 31 isoform X2 n=1 Tax=Phaenicophaeus curvirostris TaxID=33595 RepID=UPI0037F0BF02
MVLVARLLFGAALAGAFVSLYVARLELCDPPHRLEVTMVASFFWIAGELLLPGLAVLCRDWRVLQGAVTMILALLAACWWCPALLLESPRWLLATRQLEKARKILQALAESSGPSSDDGSCHQQSLLTELESLSEGSPQPRYHTVCEIFSTRVIWKNGVILGFAAPAGAHCPDPVCGGHHGFLRRHHAQHLLRQRGPPHRDQGRRAGPRGGGQLCGQGSRPHHRHPQQPRVLPPPRGVRVLCHPRRAQHHAAAGEPGTQPPPVPAGRREPAAAPALPPAPAGGPLTPACPPRHPPRLLPPRRLHQEDAGLPRPAL